MDRAVSCSPRFLASYDPSWVRARLLQRDRRLPVLVPLGRVAAQDPQALYVEIATALERDGVSHASTFLGRQLARRTRSLLVLFDGLDEGGTARRIEVARLLADFTERHPSVQVVVTCRSEVYGGILDGVADRVLHIEPFADDLIERFLHSWPTMRGESAVDRLMQALQETPRVGLLARNPLLLTMLAYLYTDRCKGSTDLLPRNRTHFYRDASELLLQRWQRQHNEFPWLAKRAVLQHLALVNQARPGSRREFTYEEALQSIAEVLPRVHIEPSQARHVLDEIVDRSGLVMRLDGGERYQFAHISMQEYFAAVELRDSPDELIRLYEADAGAWREPIKLWCGHDRDATEIVNAVARSGDDVLTLECLADAGHVDPGFAERLVRQLVGRFELAADDLPMARALGALASDPGPRGQLVYGYLSEEVRLRGRIHHIVALSASNLAAAAELLAERATAGERARFLRRAKDPLPWARSELVDLERFGDPEIEVDIVDVWPHLEAMGNVAIPVLERTAWEGADDALGRPASRNGEQVVVTDAKRRATACLATIATPRAAVALAGLLWSPVSRVAGQAAFGLAQLSDMPAVEHALGTSRLCTTTACYLDTRARVRVGDYLWVWEPFLRTSSAKVSDQLRQVFARCYLLLRAVAEGQITGVDMATVKRPHDARLVLAVFFFGRGGASRAQSTWRHDHGSLWEGLSSVEGLEPALLHNVRDDVRSRLEEEEMAAWPSRRDWANIVRSTASFRVDGSVYHLAPLALALAIAAVSTPIAWHHVEEASGPLRWVYLALLGYLVATPIAVVLSVVLQFRRWQPCQRGDNAADLIFFSPFAAIAYLATGGRRGKLELVFAGITTAGFAPAWMYGLVLWLHPGGWVWTLLATAIGLTLTGGLYAEGVRRQAHSTSLPNLLPPGPTVRAPRPAVRSSRLSKSDVPFEEAR